MRYDYTRLLVTRFAECFRFYRDVLGLAPTYGSENEVYADFSTGATGIALFNRQMMAETLGLAGLPARAAAQDTACLVFGVENVDVECERLRGLDILPIAQAQDRPDWGIRAAHFRDPDGNLIEINQPLPAA